MVRAAEVKGPLNVAAEAQAGAVAKQPPIRTIPLMEGFSMILTVNGARRVIVGEPTIANADLFASDTATDQFLLHAYKRGATNLMFFDAQNKEIASYVIAVSQPHGTPADLPPGYILIHDHGAVTAFTSYYCDPICQWVPAPAGLVQEVLSYRPGAFSRTNSTFTSPDSAPPIVTQPVPTRGVR